MELERQLQEAERECQKSGGAAREGADVRGKTATADAGVCVCSWLGEARWRCVEESRNKQTIDASTTRSYSCAFDEPGHAKPETKREAGGDVRSAGEKFGASRIQHRPSFGDGGMDAATVDDDDEDALWPLPPRPPPATTACLHHRRRPSQMRLRG